MRRVLFIENRKRTYVWKCWADALKEEGYDTAFLVYNKSFCPKDEHNYIIPYPSKSDLRPYPSEKKDEGYNLAHSSDRLINHFGKNDLHYDYYRTEIEKIVDNYAPDLVIGEVTQFYEIYTCYACKKKGILFLSPSTCRYPVHRYSFYKYDTLEPYSGSGEEISEEEAISIINAIINRNVKPDYMVKRRKSIKQLMHYYCYEAKVILSHYLGAKYIIPPFSDKLRRDKVMKKLRAEWDVIASTKKKPVDGKFIIMYPMQMQPEANLDVWGNKYMNQLNTIKGILKNTDNECIVLLKPNPKAKYELTRELLDYIRNNDRIVTVPLNFPMQDCLNKTNLVVAVTGTIAIECILMNKPIVTLHKTINNEMDNCPFVEDFCALPKYVNLVRKNSFPTISDKFKIDFLNTLNKTSFYGYPYVSDFDNKLKDAEVCANAIINLVRTL